MTHSGTKFSFLHVSIEQIMPSYLLLRSNKQSGPFSQEQLLQLGLKPYDLVWIEGKSAAWRYPSEVPELKDYAPTVEEQPYDRFYKKQADEPKEKEEVTTPAHVHVKHEYEMQTEPELKYEQYMPKKSVSVILPKTELLKSEPVKAKPELKEEPVFVPKQTSALVNSQTPVQPSEVETKYSQPLDEIKEMYVKQLQQRKHKTAQKKFIFQSLKKAAVFIAIIGCGVLIGFIIKPKNSKNKNNIVNSKTKNVSPADAQVSTNEETVQAKSDNSSLPEITKAKEQPPKINSETIANEQLSVPQEIHEKNAIEKKKVDEEKNEISTNQVMPVNTTTGDRNKKLRNDVESETNDYSVKPGINATGDILKSVSVKANNYKLKAFGGFQNLALTVSNESKFTLDNVLVELQYLKLNEQPVKVEHIRFQSIEPGGSLTIRVPENKRGAKLSYKIIKIEPKDFNTITAGL